MGKPFCLVPLKADRQLRGTFTRQRTTTNRFTRLAAEDGAAINSYVRVVRAALLTMPRTRALDKIERRHQCSPPPVRRNMAIGWCGVLPPGKPTYCDITDTMIMVHELVISERAAMTATPCSARRRSAVTGCRSPAEHASRIGSADVSDVVDRYLADRKPAVRPGAGEMAWKEDNRRAANGTQHEMATGDALAHPVSRVWCGYWQRSL